MTQDIHQHRHENPEEDVKIPIDLRQLLHIQLLIHQPNDYSQTNQDRWNDPAQSYRIKNAGILKIFIDLVHAVNSILSME